MGRSPWRAEISVLRSNSWKFYKLVKLFLVQAEGIYFTWALWVSTVEVKQMPQRSIVFCGFCCCWFVLGLFWGGRLVMGGKGTRDEMELCFCAAIVLHMPEVLIRYRGSPTEHASAPQAPVLMHSLKE